MMKEMIAKIEVFKQEFKDEFGIEPDVTLIIKDEKVPTTSLFINDIKYAIDFLFSTDEKIDKETRELGLWTKSRKRDIVFYKYVACHMIMKNRFYTYAFVGLKMNYTHATIIHAITTIDNLLDAKDKRVTQIYNRVKKFVNEADFRDKISDEYNNRQPTDT